MSDTAARLLDAVASIARVLRAESRRQGLAARLQPVHLQALAYLARANRYSDRPQALAEYLGATKGTVSQSLLLLHRRGLLERRPDERDRRVVHLVPSAAGRALLEGGEEVPDWVAVLEEMDAGALVTAAQVLEEALGRVQRRRGGRSFGLCRTCRFFRHEADGYRCGLTGEPLGEEDSRRICREHEHPA